MRTVEQTLSLIKELSETNYNGADYTRYLEQELRTAIEELAADAGRFKWLTDDLDTAHGRVKRNEILDRMSTMSYLAACVAIDVAEAESTGDKP